MIKQNYHILWQGINIEIFYNPDYSVAFRKVYGYPLVHLEIASISSAKLPISDTGYMSHFCGELEISEHGGPQAFVRKWLDHAALNSKWQHKVEQSRQLSLF